MVGQVVEQRLDVEVVVDMEQHHQTSSRIEEDDAGVAFVGLPSVGVGCEAWWRRSSWSMTRRIPRRRGTSR